MENKDKKFLKRFAPLTVFLAALCCFTPVVLVLLGLSTVSFALSVEGVLYGQFDWAFKLGGLLFLAGGLFWYFYKKEGICTLNQAKRNRQRIINVSLIAFISIVILYIIWFYVAIPYIGKLIGLYK